MKLELVTEFSHEETQQLWAAGVDMDDWNFAVIGDVDILEWQENWEDSKKMELKPKNWTLERIMETCGYNYKCYLINFCGKDCAICLQYH